MQKPDIQGVLLDLDGTLIDAFEPIIAAMQQTLQAFGLPQMSAKDIRRHTGRGDCSMTSLFGAKKEAATERFIAIHDQSYLDGIKAMDGAEELLDFLRASHLPMAVVTSKGQHRAEAQLNSLGWMHYFGCVVGKLDGRASKPNPEPLLLACKQLGIVPEYAVMVGDGEADVQAAYRAGCYGVGLTHSFDALELELSGANICFKSLNELIGWLK